MKELDYWKKRCELAESYIEESPCDPDITINQLAAYSAWNDFKSSEEQPAAWGSDNTYPEKLR